MHTHAGVVTVSPSGVVAPVCYGGQLALTCTTSVTGMFLQWSFSLIRGNDTTPTLFTRTIIPSVSTNEAMSYLILNSAMFNFSRISAQNILPLMSRLLIGPADGRLNGTEVNCEDLDSSERAATVINVIECQCTGKYVTACALFFALCIVLSYSKNEEYCCLLFLSNMICGGCMNYSHDEQFRIVMLC